METNIKPVRQGLGSLVEFNEVKAAGHFAFLKPCPPGLKDAQPNIWHMVCVDAADFDRVAFHRQLGSKLTAFFDKHLKAR